MGFWFFRICKFLLLPLLLVLILLFFLLLKGAYIRFMVSVGGTLVCVNPVAGLP